MPYRWLFFWGSFAEDAQFVGKKPDATQQPCCTLHEAFSAAPGAAHPFAISLWRTLNCQLALAAEVFAAMSPGALAMTDSGPSNPVS
jgi:hypothetical protein